MVVLGATGSIGESALKVARDIPDRMEIAGLAAKSNARKLAAQANLVRPEAVCLVDEANRRAAGVTRVPARDFRRRRRPGRDRCQRMPTWCWWRWSDRRPAAGARGDRGGEGLAVASKEILVMAGEAVMSAAARKGVRVLPVDSEHNAIFQCLEGQGQGPMESETGISDIGSKVSSDMRRIILTATGGPFRGTPNESSRTITPSRR